MLGSTMPTAVVALLPCCRKQNPRVNARTTASTNPKQLGSMMPTVVGALQHWLKAVLLHLIKDVRLIASLLALSIGNMTQAAVAALDHSWRSIPLRHQDPVQAGASMRDLPHGHMIQIAEAAPRQTLPTGLPQAASATASMLVQEFGNTILTAKLASHCS